LLLSGSLRPSMLSDAGLQLGTAGFLVPQATGTSGLPASAVSRIAFLMPVAQCAVPTPPTVIAFTSTSARLSRNSSAIQSSGDRSVSITTGRGGAAPAWTRGTAPSRANTPAAANNRPRNIIKPPSFGMTYGQAPRGVVLYT